MPSRDRTHASDANGAASLLKGGQFSMSFAQRRQQIVGDCFQLKTDVDVYNGKCPAMQPIQVPLDFTLDVEEMQLPLRGRKAA